MKIYMLKGCDRSRSVLRRLTDAGGDPVVVDVRADGLDRATIARFLGEFGEALVNRRSTTWRGLSRTERARPAAELLARYPTLMRRPVIEAGGRLWAGWDQGAVAGAMAAAGARPDEGGQRRQGCETRH